LALGRGLFVGPAVPCGLCRELPLGTGCAESIGACAERSLLSAKPQIPVVIHDCNGGLRPLDNGGSWSATLKAKAGNRCFNCLTSGHRIDACRDLPRCILCLKFGHKARWCRSPPLRASGAAAAFASPVVLAAPPRRALALGTAAAAASPPPLPAH
jgi:hypothetical protein